jgi:hypothetical protein
MSLSDVNRNLNEAKGELGKGIDHISTADEQRQEISLALGLTLMTLGQLPPADDLESKAYNMLGSTRQAREAYGTSHGLLEQANNGMLEKGNDYLDVAIQLSAATAANLADSAPIFQNVTALAEEVTSIARELAQLRARTETAYQETVRHPEHYFQASKEQAKASIDQIVAFQNLNKLPPE